MDNPWRRARTGRPAESSRMAMYCLSNKWQNLLSVSLTVIGNMEIQLRNRNALVIVLCLSMDLVLDYGDILGFLGLS
jgi:hypothetical protein